MKNKKNNIHPNNNPFIYQIDKNTIICCEQIENWEDDYISEKNISDKSEAVYAWKYIKK